MASWTNRELEPAPIHWGVLATWVAVFIGCAGFWASWAVLLVLALS